MNVLAVVAHPDHAVSCSPLPRRHAPRPPRHLTTGDRRLPPVVAPLVETDAEPHDPANVYYFGRSALRRSTPTSPSTSRSEERNEEAILRHESQVERFQAHGGVDTEFDGLLDSVRAEAQALGRQTGVRLVEGYARLHESASAHVE